MLLVVSFLWENTKFSCFLDWLFESLLNCSFSSICSIRKKQLRYVFSVLLITVFYLRMLLRCPPLYCWYYWIGRAVSRKLFTYLFLILFSYTNSSFLMSAEHLSDNTVYIICERDAYFTVDIHLQLTWHEICLNSQKNKTGHLHLSRNKDSVTEVWIKSWVIINQMLSCWHNYLIGGCHFWQCFFKSYGNNYQITILLILSCISEDLDGIL